MSLLDEFYKEIQPLYPDLSIDECRAICNAPFKFTKEVINRGIMKNIRLQYFGVFEVSPSRVKYSLQALENNFKEGKITEERYNRRKEILTKNEKI